MTTASRDRSLLWLLALVTALTAELVRASGPLLDRAFAAGVTTAAVTALVAYALPGAVVAAFVARGRVTGRSVLVAVSLLVTARLGLQALAGPVAERAVAPTLGTVRYYVGLGTVALALAVLVLVAVLAAGARSPGTSDDGADDGGARGLLVAQGVTLGLLGAAAVSLLLGTWDAVWRDGLAGWLPAVLLGAGSLAAAWAVRGTGATAGVRGLWVLGPFLALGVQVWANPAFVAATTGLPPVAATVGVAVAALLAGAALSMHRPAVRPLTAAAVFVVGVWALFLTVPRVEGPPLPWAWGLLVVATLLPAVGARALAGALTRPLRPFVRWRTIVTGTAVGLGTALPLLVYQLDFDVPLPFPVGLVPVVTAFALVLAGVVAARRLAPRRVPGGAALTGTVAGLAAAALVPGLVTGTSSGEAPGPAPTSSAGGADRLTVMTWNVHYGVSSDPSVRLGEMVEVLHGVDADVVALQEVSRGWVLGGGADMLTHLADATGMEAAWAPAADRRFGNALLWDPDRVEAADVDRVELPFGDGPQDRSSLAATVTPAGGEPLRVVTTHLQHREENTATRLDQLDALFAAEPVDGPTVLLGDLNAEPGWPEITAITDRGLVSGQDAVGDPAALTSPAVLPRHRVDWVFATPDLPFAAVEVLDVVPSDHRPVVATLELP